MKAQIQIDAGGRKRVAEACAEPCTIQLGMCIIGGKWKASIAVD